MSLILTGAPEDFDLTDNTIVAMQGRVARLQRKARILRDPILTESERRDMMRAINQYSQ